MPLPGGAADKAGNRYELRRTVRQFIRLLTGEAFWIYLEPIGAEGELVEFRLGWENDRKEVHQVKRQQAGKGHWTLADLERVSVLEGVRQNAVASLVFHIFASLAEFERSIIRERTLADLAAARARGRTGGRPPALSEDQLAAAKALLAASQSVRALAIAMQSSYWPTKPQISLPNASKIAP